jgi:hypothetical protein
MITRVIPVNYAGTLKRLTEELLAGSKLAPSLEEPT